MVFLIGPWIVLFYVIPRPNVFNLGGGNAQRRLIGFSETLNLGETGTLGENPFVVMRVRPLLNEDVPFAIHQKLKGLLIRGCSFVRYSKGSWNRKGYFARPIDLRQSGGQIGFPRSPGDTRATIQLEIILENTDPPLVFVPDQAVSVDLDIPLVFLENDGTIRLPHRALGIEAYRTELLLGSRDLSTWATSGEVYSQRFLAPFLDPGDASLRIEELAQEVASGCITDIEKIWAVENHLQRECRYSLESPPDVVRDPIAHFLFTTNEGTCEHFSSAMVLMLRFLGIPARPVNGYLMGEWNSVGQFFTIRQGDAHSWVEVFQPGHGWVAFDPTPASTVPTPAWKQVGIFREIWERFEGLWFSLVYRFDKRAQEMGFSRLKTRFEKIRAELFRPIPIALVLVLLMLLRRKRSWRAGGEMPETGGRRWIPAAYNAWVARSGFVRNPWETPKEFHSRLMGESAVPETRRPDFREIERLLEEVAFGKPGTSIQKELEELLSRMAPHGSTMENPPKSGGRE